jgi:hypothetical protein
MVTWTHVDVECACGKQSSIRVDQFNRKNGTWSCRSCAHTGRKSPRKGTGVKANPEMEQSRRSYYKARRRVKTNHKGAYAYVEFRFVSFEQWFAELGPRPLGMSVDRIDPMGHYEPGNVRWATVEEQAKNRNPRFTWTAKSNQSPVCVTNL